MATQEQGLGKNVLASLVFPRGHDEVEQAIDSKARDAAAKSIGLDTSEIAAEANGNGKANGGGLMRAIERRGFTRGQFEELKDLHRKKIAHHDPFALLLDESVPGIVHRDPNERTKSLARIDQRISQIVSPSKKSA